MTLHDDTRFFEFDGAFPLESGDVLPNPRVAYRTWGTLNEARDNAVLVCHALTGNADADNWWSGLFATEGGLIAGPPFEESVASREATPRTHALDPSRDFIVCSNVLGSVYGTTGPTSPAPDGRPWQSRFPDITVRDIVRLQHALLRRELGVNRLRLVIGGSLGGMQVLEWALLFPTFVDAIVPIATSARHSAWAIGWSEAQRQAIYGDPNWKRGRYSDDARPSQGLAVARVIAMATYRSWTSFEKRFGRRQCCDGTYDVERYLHKQGDKLDSRFDANAYVTLTRTMDSHDIARGRGRFEEIARLIEQPALVVSITSDVLYPPVEQEQLASLLPNGELVALDSPHGHDAFLIDVEALNELIVQFRERIESSAEVYEERAV